MARPVKYPKGPVDPSFRGHSSEYKLEELDPHVKAILRLLRRPLAMDTFMHIYSLAEGKNLPSDEFHRQVIRLEKHGLVKRVHTAKGKEGGKWVTWKACFEPLVPIINWLVFVNKKDACDSNLVSSLYEIDEIRSMLTSERKIGLLDNKTGSRTEVVVNRNFGEPFMKKYREVPTAKKNKFGRDVDKKTDYWLKFLLAVPVHYAMYTAFDNAPKDTPLIRAVKGNVSLVLGRDSFVWYSELVANKQLIKPFPLFPKLLSARADRTELQRLGMIFIKTLAKIHLADIPPAEKETIIPIQIFVIQPIAVPRVSV